MAQAETVQRPMRMCDSCGQVDDHPRHVFALAPGDAETTPAIAALAVKNAPKDHVEAVMAQVLDTATIYKHMDCCRTDGCPDGSCHLVTAGAEDKKGDALVKHLTSLPTTTKDDFDGGVEPGGRNEDEPFTESTATSSQEG